MDIALASTMEIENTYQTQAEASNGTELVTSNEANPSNTLVVLHGEKLMTTARQVAEYFGKQHKDVLRAYRDLKISNEFNRRNFAPIDYIDKNGETQTTIEMTKSGFARLAMGFTGEKADQFKEAYINAFDAMEEEIDRQRKELYQLACREANRLADQLAKVEALPSVQQVKATLLKKAEQDYRFNEKVTKTTMRLRKEYLNHYSKLLQKILKHVDKLDERTKHQHYELIDIRRLIAGQYQEVFEFPEEELQHSY